MSAAVPDTARMEIKFVAEAGHYHILHHWLRMHAAGFVSPFPDRRVNNVYFDTYDYTAFDMNLSGASDRAKVRYRWYGESTEPDAGALEVKCRRNFYGWKKLFKVAWKPFNQGDSWHDIRAALIAQLPGEGREWLKTTPLPVLLNRYRRRYFLSADRRIRATLDAEQSVFDQRFKPAPNFHRRANLPDTLVVEFKFDRRDHDRAADILGTIPLRVSRNSKYVTAVRAISEY